MKLCRREGFTLLEAVIAIALFASLSAAAISAVAVGNRSNAMQDAALREQNFMDNLRECVDAFSAGDGDSLEELLDFSLGEGSVTDGVTYYFDADLRPFLPLKEDAAYRLTVRCFASGRQDAETVTFCDWELTLYRLKDGEYELAFREQLPGRRYREPI